MGMNTYRSKNDHSEHESWESRIGEELRASVSARAESFGATPHNYPLSDVMERVRVRARRRQARRAGVAVAACVATIAAVVGYRMLDDEPSRVTVVAEAEQGLNPAAAPAVPAAPAEPAAEPVDPDVAPAAANPAPADAPPDDISAMLAEISSGPSLDWSPVSTGLWDVEKVQSLGDGRVLLHGSVNVAELPQVDTRPVTLVTADGETWTEVSFPQEVSHDHVAVDGDHWVVAGVDMSSDFMAGESGDQSQVAHRVFMSRDAGTTWTEISIQAAVSAETSQPVKQRSSIELLMVRGTDIVIAVGSVEEFDVVKLAEESGVVPEGRTVLGWAYSGLDDDNELALVLDSVAADSEVESFESGATTGPVTDNDVTETDVTETDVTETDSGLFPGALEGFPVSFSELGLSPEQRESLVGGPDNVTRLLYSGGGTAEVTHTVEGSAVGTATETGFAVYLTNSEAQGSVLISSDGRNWTETLQDTWSIYSAGFTSEAAWIPIVNPAGTTLNRTVHGRETQTVATLDGVVIASLDVGPAGLLVSALQIDGNAMESVNDLINSATATVVRDGYELRYNDPPGGLTLVDLSTGEEVIVSSFDELASGNIDGVRESADGGLTFVDPATGEDLVAFTSADSESIQSQLTEIFSEAAVAGEPEVEVEDSPVVIGWSADGTDWAWQTQRDAFGVGDEDAWSQLAVGQDYVIAAVRQLPSVDSENSSIEGPRVFVAHTGG